MVNTATYRIFRRRDPAFDLVEDPLEMRDMSVNSQSLARGYAVQTPCRGGKWNDEAHPWVEEFWSKRDDIKVARV